MTGPLLRANGVREVYRLLAGTLAVVSVLVLYWYHVRDANAVGLVFDTVTFFSYFTILTNLLVAAALLVPVAVPHSRTGRFLMQPPVRTAIVGYIIIVGLVYHLLLSHIDTAQGLRRFFENILHYVMPPLFVIDWLVFVPKGQVPWRSSFVCLAFPAAYLVWISIYGAVSGWYPYFFINLAELGLAQALVNVTGLAVAFLMMAFALVALDRGLGRALSPSRQV